MRQLALLLIGLFFGGGIGFLIAAAQGVTLDGHDHSTHLAPADHSHHMAHAPVDLPAGPNAPILAATLEKDLMGGWNLHLQTRNFRFAPEAVNGANVAGEGHAHVYVNGAKVSRLYSPWLHLDALPGGDVTIRAELNANDHSPLTVAGAPVAVDLVVTVE